MSKIEVLEFFPTVQTKWNIQLILSYYSEEEEAYIELEEEEIDEALVNRLLEDINGIVSGTGQIPQIEDVILDRQDGDLYCVYERFFDCRTHTVTLSLF